MLDIIRLAGKNIDLCLVRNDEEALETYCKWVNDETINMWVGHQDEIIQIGEERRYIQDVVDGKDNRSICNFNIVVKDTRQLIGICSIEPKRVNATLGILIGESDGRNKGYGTEAIKMLIDYAFNTFCNINRVELNVVGDNERAIKCYEKAGLTQCGAKHEACYFNGKFHDLNQMEILRKTWENRKEE